jgi:hypothetical protein
VSLVAGPRDDCAEVRDKTVKLALLLSFILIHSLAVLGSC